LAAAARPEILWLNRGVALTTLVRFFTGGHLFRTVGFAANVEVSGNRTVERAIQSWSLFGHIEVDRELVGAMIGLNGRNMLQFIFFKSFHEVLAPLMWRRWNLYNIGWRA
jgi:hypothetical protein